MMHGTESIYSTQSIRQICLELVRAIQPAALRYLVFEVANVSKIAIRS